MICRDDKCVFVHVPKAAGQSIEDYFLSRHGLNRSTRSSFLLRENRDPSAGPPRLAHLTAKEYVSLGYMAETEYAEYFSFSFVRNPYGRTVSLYKHLGFYPFVSFKDFVYKHLTGKLWENQYWFVRPQSDYIYDNENQLVDFIGKFESIAEDFEYVCERLGFEDRILPHSNKAGGISRKKRFLFFIGDNFLRKNLNRPGYAHYYDNEISKVVRELYASDFDRFNYDP